MFLPRQNGCHCTISADDPKGTTKKLVIVGGSRCGKSALLIALKKQPLVLLESVYIANVEECKVDVVNKLDKTKKYVLNCTDTCGDSSYDIVRPLSYPMADCFLICYSIADRDSFDAVDKFYKDIVQYFDKVPIILVGLKSDKRNNNCATCVTTQEGLDKAESLSIGYFFEISTKNYIAGIEEDVSHFMVIINMIINISFCCQKSNRLVWQNKADEEISKEKSSTCVLF